ncbi:MAG: hypothetical protein GY714_03665 [Desulfobacterales bacterium]|nr:hypothetical protein [Desulfobacterales bacterium]MCP4159907.1 hypothetical protein [Deltaproteobacteria bacterium]
MAWRLKFDSDLRFVELVLSGVVTGADIHEATSKCIAMTNEKGVPGILIDSFRLELAPSIADLYSLPAEQFVQEDLSHKVLFALIIPESPKLIDYAEFYKTICNNRGWVVKLFETRKDAIELLINQ